MDLRPRLGLCSTALSVRIHEALRLWRLGGVRAEGAIRSGEHPTVSSPADAFELVLDPSSSPSGLAPRPLRPGPLRPSLNEPRFAHEVAVGEAISSIISKVQASGVTASADELMRRARFHLPGVDLSRLRPGTLLRFEPVTEKLAPTQTQLVHSAIVRDAVEQAWRDSNASDPNLRHEEGGWLYMNVESGQVFVHRAPSGSSAGIDLRSPVPYVDAVVVGTFHTHPHPIANNYDLGPSESDRNWDYSRGVPGIVRSVVGYHTHGWERRRLDLAGPWAYPGTEENDLSSGPGPVRSSNSPLSTPTD